MCHGKRGQIEVIVKGTLCVPWERGQIEVIVKGTLCVPWEKGPDWSQ